MSEFNLDTDDLIKILGALFTTAVMLEKEPRYKEAYKAPSVDLVRLADKVGTAFVNEALRQVKASPDDFQLHVAATRDMADVAALMAAGISAFESYYGPVYLDEESVSAEDVAEVFAQVGLVPPKAQA